MAGLKYAQAIDMFRLIYDGGNTREFLISDLNLVIAKMTGHTDIGTIKRIVNSLEKLEFFRRKTTNIGVLSCYDMIDRDAPISRGCEESI